MITDLNEKEWAKVREFMNGYTRGQVLKEHGGRLGYELARRAKGGKGRGPQQALAPSLVTEAMKWCRADNAGPATGAGGSVEHLQE
jgi:hypothetical protein